jgi:hypothetical protein
MGLRVTIHDLRAPPGIKAMGHPFPFESYWRQSLPMSITRLEPGNEI